MRFILVLRSTFELLQEPVRFVLTHQTSMVELLFTVYLLINVYM